jgi:hypothetical protein
MCSLSGCERLDDASRLRRGIYTIFTIIATIVIPAIGAR